MPNRKKSTLSVYATAKTRPKRETKPKPKRYIGKGRVRVGKSRT